MANGKFLGYAQMRLPSIYHYDLCLNKPYFSQVSELPLPILVLLTRLLAEFADLFESDMAVKLRPLCCQPHA